jgi:hypothetical protein
MKFANAVALAKIGFAGENEHMPTGYSAWTTNGIEPLPAVMLTRRQVRYERLKLSLEMVDLVEREALPQTTS